MPSYLCAICRCHVQTGIVLCPDCGMTKLEEYMFKNNIREMTIVDIAECMGCTVLAAKRRLNLSKKFISKIGSGSIMIKKGY